MGLHQFAQAFVQNMGVNLRRRNISMAQHLLDRPHIGALISAHSII